MSLKSILAGLVIAAFAVVSMNAMAEEKAAGAEVSLKKATTLHELTLTGKLVLKEDVKGDAKVAAISAASILAKVTRDRGLQALHAQYPQYGFDRHKGYGTAAHLAALHTHGPCEAHRRSFAPVAQAAALFTDGHP